MSQAVGAHRFVPIGTSSGIAVRLPVDVEAGQGPGPVADDCQGSPSANLASREPASRSAIAEGMTLLRAAADLCIGMDPLEPMAPVALPLAGDVAASVVQFRCARSGQTYQLRHGKLLGASAVSG